jgi:CubicO group peptidase (beta-lactamase class C family)
MNPSTSEIFNGFDEYVAQTMQEWHVPGMAIGVVRNDEILLSQGYGLRDQEQNLPVTPETIFGIASVSKAFTTFALALLVERGLLDWDRPVQEYIPWFRLQDPAASLITPRDLVCHRSGLPRHDRAWYLSGSSREDVVRKLAFLPSSRPFRSFYQYQNMMFVAAGFLVEQVSGESWESFVQREVFDPLGMRRSNFSVETSQQIHNIALPYAYANEDISRIPFANVDALGPAGSINAPVADMLRWLRLHMGKGQVDGQRLISTAVLQETHRQQMVAQEVFPESLFAFPERGPLAYGLGWFLRTYRGRRMIFHSGGIDGFGSYLSFLPDEGLGVVILSNLDETNCPVPVTYEIYDRLLGLEPRPWSKRYLSYEGMLSNAAKAASQKEKDQKVPGTLPSHPMADYLGRYAHPGYGTLHIEAQRAPREEDQAASYTGRFNLIPLTLEHVHYDTFEAATPSGHWTRLTFLSGDDGEIEAVRLPAEPNVAPLVFSRQPEQAWTEAATLDMYAGAYTLEEGHAVQVRVSPNGPALTVQLPGHPPRALEPVRKDVFRTAGYPRCQVSFLRSDAGQVESLELLHTSGLFMATRNYIP